MLAGHRHALRGPATPAAASPPAGATHLPVLAAEIVAGSQAARAATAGGLPPRQLVDCTVGGGGHAAALLAAYPSAQLFALDRDPTAVAAARARLAPWGARAVVAEGCFADIADHLAAAGHGGGADVLVADFGLCSAQLDTPARGFSWRFDAPLDMRMGGGGMTAAELIAAADAEQLADILRRYGEERWAWRIARALARTRPTTTAALAELVCQTVPPGPPGRRHPATRTFQALRMVVNDELGQINALLRQLAALLAPGGVAWLISFHSLEDQAVRDHLAAGAAGCCCPRGLPACACGRTAAWTLCRPRLRRASPAEVAANPRSRSARLRGLRRADAAAAAGR